MRSNLKRIIPILLVIAVIGAIGWYLFSYDRDFTRDILLKQARSFEQNGNHAAAAWFYNIAYRHAGDDEDVAIELAEQYKSNGNYTKAEYTLSNAIADGGTVKLYLALCQTYVEQDKLLDAVAMLDRVSDPDIKAQLDAMRPQAPTASHTPGYYSQYITVELEAASGTLYATTDKQYPSLDDVPYSGGIGLVGGENTIYALAVGEDGLVSPLTVFSYTVGGVVEPVTLSDSALDTLVRQQLGIEAGTQLYSSDLWNVTSLSLTAEVTDYSGLKWLPYLETLTIESGSFSDLSSLSGLSHLRELTIRDSIVSPSDVDIISNLPSLKNLTLTGCQISTIEDLDGAMYLEKLDLSNNAIRDISSLSFMSNLKELNLSQNALTNLSFISALTGLEKLNVSYNSLTSILPLAGCPALTELDISHNSIANLTGVEALTGLTRFYAKYNDLTESALLAGCTELIELDLSNNAIVDISALSTLEKMVAFDFSNNQVISLPQWSKSCQLVVINGSNNRIQSIDPLAGLENINTIQLDHNLIPTVDALTECPQLVQVDVFGNPISDVSQLTAMSIIVNYDPT